MKKVSDIQTELRNRMLFLCNSICHMLGEDVTRWTVFTVANNDFPALCGYEINYYHDDSIATFSLTLKKSTEKGKFILVCKCENSGEKTEYICSLQYVTSEYVALHEYIKAHI